ncbi:hypothetical protein C4K04_0630 [Pseudomonas chlororaphis]|uniref:Uncharacterized protein n=1 Tax=Pseudomonas chlororaphis TaxID=587753 RepID=A0A3G7TH63_9PSED|nr:hypothetical protein C4K04_0630 [Pseudomonas chlororaphis]
MKWIHPDQLLLICSRELASIALFLAQEGFLRSSRMIQDEE